MFQHEMTPEAVEMLSGMVKSSPIAFSDKLGIRRDHATEGFNDTVVFSVRNEVLVISEMPAPDGA